MDSLKLPLLILVVLGALTAFFFMQPRTPASRPVKPSGTEQQTADQDELIRKATTALDKNSFEEILSTLAPLTESDDPNVQSLLGYAHAGMKNFDAAVAAFEKALEKKRDTRFGYALAYVLETMGAPDKAKALYEDLSRASLPRQIMIKIHLGIARCALLVNDPASALESYKYVIREDPTIIEPFVGMLKMMKMTGQAKGIDKLREKGDLLHLNTYSYCFWLGSVYYETGDFAKALDFFRRCIKIDNDNSSPYYYVYKILRRSQKIDEAVMELERFHALNPNLPYIFFQAAIDAKTENRLDIAFKFLRTSVTMDRSLLGRDDQGVIAAVEKHVTARGTPEEKIFLPALTEFINSNFAKAAELARTILPGIKDPALRADTERLIGEAEVVLKNEACYNAYLAKVREDQNAELAMLRNKLAKLRNTTPGSDEARLDALRKAALDNPRDAKLQYSTALHLARAGDIAGAKLFLQETIRVNPGIGEAYYSLGKLLHFEGNDRDAIAQLQQAVRQNPSDSQSRSLLATIQLAGGESENAEQEARASLLINPNNGEARLVLVQTHIQANHPEKALEEIETGLELERDPSRRNQLLELRKSVKGSR